MLTRDELFEQHGMSVERYGAGYLLADYSGHRGEASFCGISGEWRHQPIVYDPFLSVEAATTAAVSRSLGPPKK